MDGISFDIKNRPDFATLEVMLQPGQKILVEPSAMACMSPSIQMKSGVAGGALRSIGRMLAGESFIVNTFSAQDQPGELVLVSGHLGDILHHRLDGIGLRLQRGAFLANGPGVEVSSSWQGAKGFFSGEGLVLLKAQGQGDLFFNSYGAILEIDVKGDFYVDTSYVVAFEETLQYRISTLPGLRGGGFKRLFFSGEGLVCQFTGHGKLWVQTRSATPYLSQIHSYRPVQRNNN